MDVILSPSRLRGTVHAPASKSDFQRACAAALLHNGKTVLENSGKSADDKAALQLAVDLGLEILSQTETTLTVQSTGKIRPRNREVFCGESGLTTRLFIPIAALGETPVTFSGEGSLLSRPLHFFYEILPQLGVQISGNGATLPLTVQGSLQPKTLTVDGSLSSQFISGLLFAFSAVAKEEILLKIENPVSQPYLEMTVATLRAFGKEIFPETAGVFRIFPKKSVLPKDVFYPVEGDWSSAAVWITAAALGADIGIKGLSPASLQADRVLIEILKQTGLEILWENEILRLQGVPQNGFSFDLTDAPDLFPVLAVLAFSIPGESRIRGLHRLIHKESNRLESVAEMLRRGGISFEISPNEMMIPGRQVFDSATISSFNDHRIVMAASLTALNASGPVRISGIEAVSKSYPAFLEDLRAMGGVVGSDLNPSGF